MGMTVKNHLPGETRGKRDPKMCKVQTGGTLVWVETKPDGTRVNCQWTDRPHKFRGHIAHRLRWFNKRGRTVFFEDIKWKQLGSETWWRIPDWPEGKASS